MGLSQSIFRAIQTLYFWLTLLGGFCLGLTLWLGSGRSISLSLIRPYVISWLRPYGLEDLQLAFSLAEKGNVALLLTQFKAKGMEAARIQILFPLFHPTRIQEVRAREVVLNPWAMEGGTGNALESLAFLHAIPFLLEETTLLLPTPVGKDQWVAYNHLAITHSLGKITIRQGFRSQILGQWNLTKEEESLTLSLQWHGIPFPEGAALLGNGGIQGIADLTLQGRIQGSWSPHAPDPWSFSFWMQQEKAVSYPSFKDSIRIHHGEIRGSLTARKGGAIHGSILLDKSKVIVNAEVKSAKEQRPVKVGALLQGELSISKLLALWPEPALPSVRQWIGSHFHQGVVHSLAVNGSSLEEITGHLAIQGATLSFLEDTPPIIGLNALVQVNMQGLSVQITHGVWANNTLKGVVEIRPLVGLPQLTLAIRAQGPFSSFLPAIAKFASISSLPIKHIHGEALSQIQGDFPLLLDLPRNQVHLHLDTQVKNASFQIPIDQGAIPITEGTLSLQGNEDSFSVSGKSKVAEIPTQWRWGKEAHGDALSFSCQVPLSKIQVLSGMDLRPYLSTPLLMQGKYTPDHTTVNLNLTSNKISLPWIRWQKKPGTPASLMLSYHKGKGTFCSQGAIQLQGHFTNDGRHFRLHDLTGQVFRAKGNNSLARYERAPNGHHRLFFRSDKLYLPVQGKEISRGKSMPHPCKSQLSKPALETVSLDFSCKALLLNQVALHDCHIQLGSWKIDANDPWNASNWVLHQGNIFASIRKNRETQRTKKGSKGPTKNQGYVAISFLPFSLGTRIFVDATDFGLLLRELGITTKIQAEDLMLRATQNRDGSIVGNCTIDHLQTKEPSLVKLLAMLSPTMLMELFSSGLSFYQIQSEFRYDRKTLELRKAIGRGVNLGLWLDGFIHLSTGEAKLRGCIVPSYFFNTFFRYLPMLGWILGGDKGLISSEFTLNGSLENPTIHLKPFSLLKLGFIKELIKDLPSLQGP